MHWLDWAAIAAALLAFVFSFISFYTANFSVSGNCPPGTSRQAQLATAQAGSATAWHGFFGWFGVVLALVGAGAIVLELLSPQTKLPAANRLIALVAFAVGAISLLIALPVKPEGDRSVTIFGCTVKASVGHGAGYWLALIAVVLGLVAVVLRFQQTGGRLPGRSQHLAPAGAGYPAPAGFGPGDEPGGPDSSGYGTPTQYGAAAPETGAPPGSQQQGLGQPSTYPPQSYPPQPNPSAYAAPQPPTGYPPRPPDDEQSTRVLPGGPEQQSPDEPQAPTGPDAEAAEPDPGEADQPPPGYSPPTQG